MSSEFTSRHLPISETPYDVRGNRSSGKLEFGRLDFAELRKSWEKLGENVERLVRKLAQMEVSEHITATPENRELLEKTTVALGAEITKIHEQIAEIQLTIADVQSSTMTDEEKTELVRIYNGDLQAIRSNLDKFLNFYDVLDVIKQNLFPEEYTQIVLRDKSKELLDKIPVETNTIDSLEEEYHQTIEPLINEARLRAESLKEENDSDSKRQVTEIEQALVLAQSIPEAINKRKVTEWENFLNSPLAPAVISEALEFIRNGATLEITKENWRKLLDIIDRFYDDDGNFIAIIGADEDYKVQYINDQIIAKLNEIKTRFGKEFNVPEVIDPNNIWQSFALTRGYIEPGDDPTSLESVEKIEAGILTEFIHLVETSLEDDPNAAAERQLTNLLAFSIRKGAEKLTYGDLVDKHPGIHGNERGSQDQFRKFVALLEHALKGGSSWGEVAKAATPSHEKVKEHMEHYLPTGEDFHEIIHLPVIPPPKHPELGDIVIENDKPYGDLILEGFSWYSQWNEVFVYLSEEEIEGIRNEVFQEVDRNSIQLPDEEELEASLRLVREGKGDALEGNESGLSNEIVLLTYVEARQNYDEFLDLCADLIAKERVVAVELERQKRFGIFPLTEAGRAKNKEEGKGLVEHLDRMRREIATAVGCYRLGLGEYIPDAGVSNGGQVEILNPDYDEDDPDSEEFILRPLTPLEKKKAYHVGKGPGMFAFQLYEASCGHFNDDSVNAKSAIPAHRLHLTELYRRNYAEFGREGVFTEGLGIVISLLPDYLTYLAVDGESLRTLVSDRERRMHADYSNLGDASGAKKVYIELYGFAENIYAAVAYSLNKVVSGADPLKLAVEEKPQGVFSLERYLDFQDELLQKIIEFGDKNIGYWLDRLYIKKSVRDAEGSIYDREYWADVPGTDLASPIVHMLNLPESDWVKIAADIKQYKFKPALRKPIMTVILIESLLRSGQKLATLAQVASLKYVLSGKIPDYYALQTKGGMRKNETDELKRLIAGTRSYSDFFRYSEGEVQRILEMTGIYMEPGLSVALKRLGGV